VKPGVPDRGDPASVAGLSGSALKRSYQCVLGAIARHPERAGHLSGALANFSEVTRNSSEYWHRASSYYDFQISKIVFIYFLFWRQTCGFGFRI
jgi:hypothetical protein